MLKVAKSGASLSLSLENTFWEKPQGGSQIDPTVAFLGLNLKKIENGKI